LLAPEASGRGECQHGNAQREKKLKKAVDKFHDMEYSMVLIIQTCGRKLSVNGYEGGAEIAESPGPR
jgi:hypothetical protein